MGTVCLPVLTGILNAQSQKIGGWKNASRFFNFHSIYPFPGNFAVFISQTNPGAHAKWVEKFLDFKETFGLPKIWSFLISHCPSWRIGNTFHCLFLTASLDRGPSLLTSARHSAIENCFDYMPFTTWVSQNPSLWKDHQYLYLIQI